MKTPIQSRTLWTIIISRALVVVWPWYRDLVREFPEVTYYLDGVVFFSLRLLSKSEIKIKPGPLEVNL